MSDFNLVVVAIKEFEKAFLEMGCHKTLAYNEALREARGIHGEIVDRADTWLKKHNGIIIERCKEEKSMHSTKIEKEETKESISAHQHTEERQWKSYLFDKLEEMFATRKMQEEFLLLLPTMHQRERMKNYFLKRNDQRNNQKEENDTNTEISQYE